MFVVKFTIATGLYYALYSPDPHTLHSDSSPHAQCKLAELCVTENGFPPPEILSNFSLKMSDFLIQISEPSDPILVFNLIFMLLMTPNLSFNHFLGKNLAPFLR